MWLKTNGNMACSTMSHSLYPNTWNSSQIQCFPESRSIINQKQGKNEMYVLLCYYWDHEYRPVFEGRWQKSRMHVYLIWEEGILVVKVPWYWVSQLIWRPWCGPFSRHGAILPSLCVHFVCASKVRLIFSTSPRQSVCVELFVCDAQFLL